jgi:hypothetical protein
MTLVSVANYFIEHWIELAGVVTTLLGIGLTSWRKMACWPVVLVSDVIYLVVFFRARLYSDALLQVFFLAFTLYGWWYWWRGVREDGEVRVVRLGWSMPAGGIGRWSGRKPGLGRVGQAGSRRAARIWTRHLPATAWWPSWWRHAQAHCQLVALDCC